MTSEATHQSPHLCRWAPRGPCGVAAPRLNRGRPSFSLTTLLELSTSEGCSSCPGADASLGMLEADPGLWTAFVPVGFHVTYWDRLGWTKSRTVHRVESDARYPKQREWRSPPPVPA